MANPGAGAKFLSVNLNKSYGQSGHSSSSNSSYYPGRGRPGGYSGGGGGGMVVLSRPRSSHKAAPKLSVPPPVNLPSLRKEHERFDPLGSGSGSSAGIGSGNGTRPASSAMGWSKASAVDNARPPSSESWDNRQQYAEGLIRNSVPTPAASLGKAGSSLSIPIQPEKISVLRGEDFPSLSATISATSGPSHKQKNGLHNQKPEMIEESSSGYRGGSRLSSEIDMRPLGHSSQSSHPDGDNLFSRPSEQVRKQDSHLPGPLPLVRLSPRSDWADDERDTTHTFSERSRDMGFSKMEPYWDKDFVFPRSSIVPHKPAQNISDRWTRQYSVESSIGNMRERNRNVPESKRTFSRVGEKPIVEDWGNTGIDESDPFSGSLLGIVKRKKDATKQLDFHDPVRESFEAELERVQKLQEQERQRIVEEQERAMEMVRKEEEERHRMLREQEEHQRQMEEEARQAVCRAEEERLEEMRKAEELKMVREEEKRRMSMEEERRKQAAKQKLLELEQKIARRQAESSVKVERVDEHSSWEDSERSVPSDSVSRPFAFTDRGKSDSWRRDVLENGNSSSLFPPEQVNGRNFSRYNANGYMASRAYYGGVFPESQLDNFPHDSASNRFDDIVLNQGDRVYQNTELDELYSYGRPRFSSRQPRVLPPPLPSMHRASFRNDSQHSGASAYGDSSSTQYNHTARSELSVSMYDNDQQEMQEDADILDLQEESGKNNVIGCDSQSSLSVSSPPHSPAHLSHDDLDDTGDSLAPAEGSEIPLSGNDSIVMDAKNGKDRMMTPLSCVSTGDDDEWAIESNAEMRGQKVYDEDEDDYHEEDEENDRDNENADLALEFEGIRLGGKDLSATENLVLGFDQGVEVGIPSDEYERSPRLENDNESLSVAPSLTVDNCTPGVIQEAETAFPDKSNNSNLSSETAVSGSQPVPVHSFSSGPALISTTASASSQSQGEMPVKLQFGLFSGPSLIPSPIPAIQIGSIQMPLQLPHQMGTSLTHMHPPQPTLFQFGQISYPSPISHGLLQLTPQSMPNVQPTYPINQKAGGPSSAQASEDGYAHSFMKDYTFPLIVESQHHNLPKFSASQMESPKEASSVQESNSGMIRSQSETKVSHHNAGSSLNQSLSSVANSIRTPVHSQASGNRGRKAPFPARSHTQKLPFTTNDAFHSHPTGFQKRPRRGIQRMEFRVRQNTDKRQSYGSLNHQSITDMKSNNNGKISGTYARLDRMRQATESVNLGCDQGGGQGTNHQIKADKGNWEETPNQLETSLHGEGRLKRHITSEEDVDAPLQSGVVRIYNQPGIEAPSDEDDFIEVRSKRQMLNDRREQREKEKAKSKIKKVMRKPRSTTQAATSVARTVVKPSTSSIREAPKNMHADVTQNRGLLSREIVKGSNIVSQSLAPIGPPPVNPEPPAGSNSHSQTDKTTQTSTLKAVSSGVQLGPGRNFESENKLCDSIQTSLGAWDNAPLNQEVMPLTQTQFDEAMKPGRVDMHQSSVEDRMKSVSELGRSTSPIIMDTSFSSSSPIKSLLAGEKIQFGAVTSRAVLPPNNNAVANGTVLPGSVKIQFGVVTSPAVPPSTRSRPSVSEKIQFGALPSPTVLPLSSSAVPHEKHLADCEAEAEAAASAIAVAAISNDEGVGSCQGSLSNTASGVAQNQPRGEPKPEEALTVSLPADLSVETPPMSLWPHLPTPHTSSNHILSPFPGAAPSPFPFYDMNPMLRGPVFAFGPHDESHKTSSTSSGPSDGAAWQPCHSGVDSFYGPPAGFPGPFPASAVQAPSHMVVYNHFAPVGGRFGQVGLSYMGTYISSTKQPDWKHNPASPPTSASDGDIKNLNMASAHHNPPNVPQPQHLASGPALLPMASPSVAMFDVSPFQSSGELPVQACWSHVPAQPVPHSMPLPQRPEDGIPPPQLRLMPIDNHSLRSTRFPANPHTPPANAEAAVIDQNAVSSNTNQNAVSRADPSKGNMHNNTISGLKAQPLEQNSSGQQQRQNNYRHGYGYQRGGGGGGAHRNSSGAEWSGRRMNFHGRNQPGNGGRGFPQPKMKQIYVAKQSSGNGGASTIQ